MIVLAIDTAGPRCAAALVDTAADGAVLAARIEAMERGHAEALLPMVETVMAEWGLGWDRVGRIAVVTGPGSFTGIRIGIAAARGLALAAGCPAVGISAFDALRESLDPDPDEPLAIALDARRGQVFLQVFDETGHRAPLAVDVSNAAAHIPDHVRRLAGSGAALVAEAASTRGFSVLADRDIRLDSLAALAALRDPDTAPATPLYLRPPDAKPQTVGIARK